MDNFFQETYPKLLSKLCNTPEGVMAYQLGFFIANQKRYIFLNEKKLSGLKLNKSQILFLKEMNQTKLSLIKCLETTNI